MAIAYVYSCDSNDSFVFGARTKQELEEKRHELEKKHKEIYIVCPGIEESIWPYKEKTKIISQNWNEYVEKLHVEGNAVKARYHSRGNLEIEFDSIKTKKLKRKKFKVNINFFFTKIFGRPIYSSGIVLAINGQKRKKFMTNELIHFNYTIVWYNNGKFSLSDTMNRTFFYRYEIGGFIGNKEATDTIHDKAEALLKIILEDFKHYNDVLNKMNILNGGL